MRLWENWAGFPPAKKEKKFDVTVGETVGL